MCGRYARKKNKKQLAEQFSVEEPFDDLPISEADYNIAPTTWQPIVRQNRTSGRRELALARWGLVPHFSQGPASVKGITTINARAESLTTARTWQSPVRSRRCLVPASAYYEWPFDSALPRRPHLITIPAQPHFAFAGLWDAWRDQEGKWLQSFSIVTTQAGADTSHLHPRSPVILEPHTYDLWLNRTHSTPPLHLLTALRPHSLLLQPASPLVNSSRNNSPQLLHPADPSAYEPANTPTLFDA